MKVIWLRHHIDMTTELETQQVNCGMHLMQITSSCPIGGMGHPTGSWGNEESWGGTRSPNPELEKNSWGHKCLQKSMQKSECQKSLVIIKRGDHHFQCLPKLSDSDFDFLTTIFTTFDEISSLGQLPIVEIYRIRGRCQGSPGGGTDEISGHCHLSWEGRWPSQLRDD